MRFIAKIVLTLSLLGIAAQANALGLTEIWNAVVAPQENKAAAAEVSGFFARIENVATITASRITTVVTDSMYTQGMTVSASFTNAALGIGGSLALMYLFVMVVMNLGTGNNDSMMALMFEVAVPCVVAAMLIQGYPTYMASFQGFLGVLTTTGTDPMANIVDFLRSMLSMISVAISQGYEQVRNFSSLNTLMYAIADLLGVLLIAIPMLFFLLLAIAEIFTLVILGPFMLAIGMAFGPIFIAGLVTPWTRTYFTSWLNFLVAAAMITGVVRVVMQIASTMINSFEAARLVTGAPVAVGLGVGLILMIVTTSLISQAPQIASALVPGSLGAKSPGSRGLTDSIKGMPGNAGKGARGVGKTLAAPFVGTAMAYRLGKSGVGKAQAFRASTAGKTRASMDKIDNAINNRP